MEFPLSCLCMGGGFLRCPHCQQSSSKGGRPQETWVVFVKHLNFPWSAQAEAPHRAGGECEGVEGSCRFSGI